jgi:hypothetical protein
MELIAKQNKEDEELAEALEDANVLPEIYEVEEAIMNHDADCLNDRNNQQVNERNISQHTVIYSIRYTLPFFKERYVKLGIGDRPPQFKKKRDLFDIIFDSTKVTKVDQNSFSYEMKEDAITKNDDTRDTPRWVTSGRERIRIARGF